MKIYVAGKWSERKEISTIMNYLRGNGHEITCDWTDHEYPTDNIIRTLENYALKDIQGVKDCDVFVFYAEHDLPYRGAFVEMGAAIALGKRVYIIGNAIDSCIFMNHPLVCKIISWRDL